VDRRTMTRGPVPRGRGPQATGRAWALESRHARAAPPPTGACEGLSDRV
jgi:hypothetical protein